MKVKSRQVRIAKNICFNDTEKIEEQLHRKGFNPLRWAIIKVLKDFYVLEVIDLIDC